jgi:hypothetical protein
MQALEIKGFGLSSFKEIGNRNWEIGKELSPHLSGGSTLFNQRLAPHGAQSHTFPISQFLFPISFRSTVGRELRRRILFARVTLH